MWITYPHPETGVYEMWIKADAMGIIIKNYRNAGCTYPHNKGNGDNLSPGPGDNFSWLSTG